MTGTAILSYDLSHREWKNEAESSSPAYLLMIYAMYEQLAEERASKLPSELKMKNARLGLTHNLGGSPSSNIAAISIIGRQG